MQGLRARIGDEGLEDEQSGTGSFIQHFADLGRYVAVADSTSQRMSMRSRSPSSAGFEGDDVGTRGRFRRGPGDDPVDG